MDVFDIEKSGGLLPETTDFISEPDFLNELNPEQKRAVKTTQGALLVLSGAGTGKTKVLTTRIAYIIHQKKAMPWQILAVTFTNKASREMKDRLESMIGTDAFSVWLGTFHAIGVRILRKYADLLGFSSNFIVLDSDDQERLIKQIMQEAGVDIKKYSPGVLLDIIQRWKDKGLLPADVTVAQNNSFCEGRALVFYHQYQDRLKSLNAVDFGDLLLLPLTLLQSHPDVLASYQQQFRYILVDEYQDTNVAQYLFLRLLAKRYGNICCVGDDDQSIYSWRGAEVDNILTFQEVFPEALIIRLERNYRSTEHILGTASGLISHNQGRLGKTLKTADENGNVGQRVSVRGYLNGNQEAEQIVASIENEQRAGVRLSQMAVLVRASFQTRLFEEALIRYGVPYKIIGGFKFYEREEIKDALAYLRLVLNSQDDLAFLRIINKPRRGIGSQTIDVLTQTAHEKKISLFDSISWASLKPAVRKTLDSFILFIKKAQETVKTDTPAQLARFILEESGYIQMWRQDKSPEAQGKVENLMELFTVLDDFKQIDEFIEYAALVTDSDNQSVDDRLVVMTLHASKGLEFRHVYLPGWEDGLFPHQKALDEGGDVALEEERRLAYVGLTRAREKVFISFANNRRMYGQWLNVMPSRFIEELPSEHIVKQLPFGEASLDRIQPAWIKKTECDFQKKYSNLFEFLVDDVEKQQKDFDRQNKSRWMREMLNTDVISDTPPNSFFKKTGSIQKSRRLGKRVYHETFGYGIVIREEGDRLEVSFDSSGVKKVMSRFLEEVS